MAIARVPQEGGPCDHLRQTEIDKIKGDLLLSPEGQGLGPPRETAAGGITQPRLKHD